MIFPLVFRIAFGLSALLLSGCVSEPAPDYAPGYSYVSTNPGGSQKGIGGSVLAPDACLGPPADTPPSRAATAMTIVPELGPHLPPGCANAYNLQRMVESQRDLVEGRQMGPAAGAPTARAARRYIYGDEAPLGGANTGPQDGAILEGN